MFTIDLLKGQGIPPKSSPRNLVLIGTAFTTLAIIGLVMFGSYFNAGIDITVQNQQISSYQAKIDRLADALAVKKSIENAKSLCNASLSELAGSIDRYIQWSPILTTLVENMPESTVLKQLEVRQHSTKRKVPRKDDPQKQVEITVPVKTLHINICADPRYNCDEAIRDFRDRLRLSDVLSPQLEDIRVSQSSDTLDKQSVVSYEMECVFKPTLRGYQ